MGNRNGRQKAASYRSGNKRITQSDLLRRAINWVLNDKMFADLQAHGNTKWTPEQLAQQAVNSLTKTDINPITHTIQSPRLVPTLRAATIQG